MINTAALKKAMHEIAERKGGFWLFGLFMRADGLGDWDLVVAARWLQSGRLKVVNEFVELLSKRIGKNALAELGRIATLPRDSELLGYIIENVQPVDREFRINSTDLRARGIEEAIIFQARKPIAHRSHRSKEPIHPTGSR